MTLQPPIITEDENPNVDEVEDDELGIEEPEVFDPADVDEDEV